MTHRLLSPLPRPGRLRSALSLCVLGTLLALSPVRASAAVGWSDSLAEGVKQARATGKPLFVVFRCVR
ncbi:MAG: hypothetical protein ACKO3P_03990 [Planctomycetaceae bacterium]